MSIVDIRWREEGDKFIIELGDDYLEWALGDYTDLTPDDPWAAFHELVNGPIFGMQGNSNYEMTEYQWLLDDAAHEVKAKTWFATHYSNTNAQRDQIALEAALKSSKLKLTEIHPRNPTTRKLLDWNSHLIVDGWKDDHGDLKRLYNVWVWHWNVDPIYRIKKGGELSYKKLTSPKAWQAVEWRVQYTVDGGDVQETELNAAPKEDIIDVLAYDLFHEYPYLEEKPFYDWDTREELTNHRIKNILKIISKECINE